MPDRIVLVTGVSGDVGSHLANELVKDAWSVCGMDVRPAREPHRLAAFAACDLADAAATEAAIAALHERFGAFDAVVNCAGLIASAPLLSFVEGRLVRHDPALWDRVVASCLSSAFYVTACTVQKMAESGKRGVVVNVSSVCSHGNAGQAAYSAAKAGVNAMTVSLAKELGPLGIRVVALSPGYFDTASTRDNVPAAKLKEIRGAVPLRRLGKLDEAADALRFLLANAYVNGKVLELDGGLVV